MDQLRYVKVGVGGCPEVGGLRNTTRGLGSELCVWRTLSETGCIRGGTRSYRRNRSLGRRSIRYRYMYLGVMSMDNLAGGSTPVGNSTGLSRDRNYIVSRTEHNDSTVPLDRILLSFVCIPDRIGLADVVSLDWAGHCHSLRKEPWNQKDRVLVGVSQRTLVPTADASD